jgi:hypothetical protein
MVIQNGLLDEDGDPITSMGASWTSKAYEFGKNFHLAIQLTWDDVAPEGNVYLEYSCYKANEVIPEEGWTLKNVVDLDGSYKELLFLDSNLSTITFRLRFEHSTGDADLDARIVMKV